MNQASLWFLKNSNHLLKMLHKSTQRIEFYFVLIIYTCLQLQLTDIFMYCSPILHELVEEHTQIYWFLLFSPSLSSQDSKWNDQTLQYDFKSHSIQLINVWKGKQQNRKDERILMNCKKESWTLHFEFEHVDKIDEIFQSLPIKSESSTIPLRIKWTEKCNKMNRKSKQK